MRVREVAAQETLRLYTPGRHASAIGETTMYEHPKKWQISRIFFSLIGAELFHLGELVP